MDSLIMRLRAAARSSSDNGGSLAITSTVDVDRVCSTTVGVGAEIVSTEGVETGVDTGGGRSAR